MEGFDLIATQGAVEAAGDDGEGRSVQGLEVLGVLAEIVIAALHDWRVCRADAPFLMVNCAGERFMAEGPKQGYINHSRRAPCCRRSR